MPALRSTACRSTSAPDRFFRSARMKNGPRKSPPIPSSCASTAAPTADFTLYEDENDNYNYEKGVYATIPLHWDDAKQALTIGDRKGQFPGMLENRTFRVVFVGENHGAGIGPEERPDKTVEYAGKQTVVAP